MKRRAHPQFDTSHLEHVPSYMPSKHWILVTNNGGGETMKLDDAIEEGFGDGGSGAGVTICG